MSNILIDYKRINYIYDYRLGVYVYLLINVYK